MYIDLILLNIWILVLLEGYVNSFTRFFMLMTFDECDYVLLLAFFSVFCFLWFYRHKIILNSFDLIYNKKRKCFIAIRMSVTYHNKLGSEKCLTHGSTVFCSSRGILWKISYVFHPIRIVSYFFLSEYFFTTIHESQDCRGKGKTFFWVLSTISTRFTDTYTLTRRLLQRVHLCTELATRLEPGTLCFPKQVVNH